jgi:hypothetical protein
MSGKYISVGDMATVFVDESLHIELNQMADMFYVSQGNVSRPDFDYYASTHPLERSAYSRALLFYSYASDVQPEWPLDEPAIDFNDVKSDMVLYDQLNEIASWFYVSQGNIERDLFDFNKSPHPGERAEFVFAYNAYVYLVANSLDWCE